MSANLPFIFVNGDGLIAFDRWWVLFVFYQKVAGVLAGDSLVDLLFEPIKLYKNGDLLFEILVAVGCVVCAHL